MQSSSLRTLTLVVTVLLLGALGFVIWLVVQSNQPTASRLPTPTSRSTSTPAPTGEPALPAATVRTDLEALPDGGFAFAPVDGYTLSRTPTSVTLTGPARDGTLNPVFLLSGGPPGQFVSSAEQALPDVFDEFVTYFAEQDNFEAGPVDELTIDGAPGMTTAITSRDRAEGFAGRIAMAQPAADRLFVLVGVAPVALWNEEVESLYDDLLNSVDLLDSVDLVDEATAGGDAARAEDAEMPAPTAASRDEAPDPGSTPLPTAPPTATPIPASQTLPTPSAVLTAEPAATVLANANFATAPTLAGDNLWAATEGGIVAWNRNGNGFARFTVLDGLAANHFTAAAACPLPGLGIVFGGPTGLQIFDTRTGRWNSLNTDNSAMSFKDVATLLCDVENQYLVVGYAQHGVDVFDAETSEWSHLDRSAGLGTDVVQDVAVIGDREEYWISSGISISVIRGDETLLLNAANSPLEVAPLYGLAATTAGTIWIAGTDRLYRVDGGTEWTVYPGDSLGGDFPTAALAGLAVDADDTVWVADQAGVICRFDLLAETCGTVFAAEPGMAPGPVTGLTAGADGGVFYTTAGNGASGYNGREWRRYEVPGEPLLDNSIRALAQDRSGFLWLGSQRGAQQLSPADPTIVRSYEADGDLPLTTVDAIAPATVTGLWFGGENGAAYFDGATWRHFTTEDGLVDNHVQALTADPQRRTWIGTRAGLSIWNGETFFNLTRENGLPSDNVTALLAAANQVWIGTSNGGLYVFTQNQLRVYNVANAGLLSNSITALALAADGAILIGSDRGLSQLQGERAVAVEEVPPIPVLSLATDEDGRVWAGTSGSGLYAYDGTAWRQVTRPLPSPTIRTLVLDRYGSLWVGGASGGVVRLVD